MRPVLAQAGPARAEDVRRAVDEVLAGEEFARGAGLFDRFRDEVGAFLERLLGSLGLSARAVGTVFEVLVWILLAVVALLVARAVVRAIGARNRPADPVRAPAATESRAQRVARLRAAARAADGRGEHVLAMRLEFTALVCALGERGDLEYRDAFTNRELLERGRPGREAEALLGPLVPELDRKSFGREPATHEDFARIAASCDRLVRAVAR